MFYPNVFPNRIKTIFSAESHIPLQRNDIAEIKNLLHQLGILLYSDQNSTVYILASSNILNSSILHSAVLTFNLNPALRNQVLDTHDVDKRDGFPLNFLTARYVVICTPIQYHLRPEDQRIIGVLAECVLKRENIGKSYKQLPYVFLLDNGVKAFIYEKFKPLEQADINSLAELFNAYYPDRNYLYKTTKKSLVNEYGFK
jgi:hypothetical protein